MRQIPGMPADGGAKALLELPFAPGDSPFRVKGNAYKGHLKYVEDRIEGGFETHQAALRNLHPTLGPKLEEFFAQTFLASAWYDVFPLATAGVACGKHLGMPFLDFVHARTVAQAEGDIVGVHKFLLKFVSAKTVAARVPALVSQYFDFIKVAAEVPNKQLVMGTAGGVPKPLAGWYGTVIEGYLQKVLEISGVVHPRVECVGLHPFPAEEGKGDGSLELVHIETHAHIAGLEATA